MPSGFELRIYKTDISQVISANRMTFKAFSQKASNSKS